MELRISQKQAQHNLTILELAGKMDGSNYTQLINEARMVYEQGVRNLLLDLSQLTYVSSAGLSAMHKTALIFRGEEIMLEESGWSAFHAIDRDRDGGVQKHVKLLSPRPEIEKILDISGFKSLFEVYSDLEMAVASF